MTENADSVSTDSLSQESGQKDKKPYVSSRELLDTANDASGPARNAWLAYLGLLTYLLVTLAGVSHVDLLLNSPVTLPIVGVKIPLFSFFIFAPPLLWIFHLGILVQHAILGHKYDYFHRAITDQEQEIGPNPDRRLVHNYVFSQLLAGPQPPLPLKQMMRLMVFMTLTLLPVGTFIYFQITFLPYHEEGVTYWHRTLIVADITLLFVLRPFTQFPHQNAKNKALKLVHNWPWLLRIGHKILSFLENTGEKFKFIPFIWLRVISFGRKVLSLLKYRKNKLRLGSDNWPWELEYGRLGFSFFAVLVVVFFSFFIATIPDEDLDEFFTSIPAFTVTDWHGRDVFWPTNYLFEGELDGTTGSTSSLLSRSIIIFDQDLVPNNQDRWEEVSHSFRGRNLQLADLFRIDLHRADLSGADLSGAYLNSANLQGADLYGANLQNADLSFAKLQKTDLSTAMLENADLSNVDLQGAELFDTIFQDTIFSGANLQRAKLFETDFQRADFSRANLQGADLSNAELQGADLSDTELQGADFSNAELQGADLSGANLQGADLSNTNLQAADLTGANLQGADLADAELQGADLSDAHLQATDFYDANLDATNMSYASIWLTEFPDSSINPVIANINSIDFTPLGIKERNRIKSTIIESIEDTTLQKEVLEKLSPLLISSPPEWYDESKWISAQKSTTISVQEESDILLQLLCTDEEGFIAEGIVNQMTGLDSPRSDDVRMVFQADLFSQSEDECPGQGKLTPDTLSELKNLDLYPEQTQ